MRSPRYVLLALFVLFGAWNLWLTLVRSTIPVALDGVVYEIDRRIEKDPGSDDVYLVTVGATTHHVDIDVAVRLEEGDRVHKDRWDREMVVNKDRIRLRPSTDLMGMLLAMPVVVGVGAIALRERQDAPGSPGSPSRASSGSPGA